MVKLSHLKASRINVVNFIPSDIITLLCNGFIYGKLQSLYCANVNAAYTVQGSILAAVNYKGLFNPAALPTLLYLSFTDSQLSQSVGDVNH